MSLTRKLLHVGATALMLSTIATVSTFVTADTAYAERGNGNGNGNGRANRGNSERGNNGRGAIASELKWMNAAHANANAFANASSNSRPGQLNTFKEEYAAAQAAVASAQEALDAAEDDLAEAEAIRDFLLTLDETTYVPTETYPTYAEALAAAENNVLFYSGAVTTAEGELAAANALVDAAVDGLDGGSDLSEDAFAALLSMLGL